MARQNRIIAVSYSFGIPNRQQENEYAGALRGCEKRKNSKLYPSFFDFWNFFFNFGKPLKVCLVKKVGL